MDDDGDALLTDEQRAFIWQQASDCRDETKAYILVSLHSGFNFCPHCASGEPLVATRDADEVCLDCGVVVRSRMARFSFADLERTHRSAYIGYKHVFHFNERLANLDCADPCIPEDVFALVELAFERRRDLPRGADMGYADVRSLLRSVIVPADIGEKYRGKRYKMLPLTNLCDKFSERWLTIRYRLTGHRPPPLARDLKQRLQMYFCGILAPFGKIRHKPECDAGLGCHKRFGCEYKLPPYAFIMKELLFLVGGPGLLLTYEDYLIHKTTDRCMAKLRRTWEAIANYNSWPVSWKCQGLGPMRLEHAKEEAMYLELEKELMMELC